MMLSPVKSILVCDDDASFRRRLARALRDRDCSVYEAETAHGAVGVLSEYTPEAVVIDLRMPGESGLWFIRQAQEQGFSGKIVVLTGFGSISTALDAIRLGAYNYLTKPASVDQILEAFLPQSSTERKPIPMPSLAEVEAEYVQRVVAECDGNVSQSAKILGVHRRSLQRKLKR